MVAKGSSDGSASAAKGSIKEAIGMLVGDDQARADGAAEKAEAEAQEKRDKAKDLSDETADQ